MASVGIVEAAASGEQRPGRRARRRPGARRPCRALPGTWRGVLWTLVIAADFFLMSNPLVFVAGMDRALTLSAMLTGAALVLTAPWVRAPRVSWPVLLFLGWLLLSSTWSIQPAYTVAAWAQTAVVAAVALAAAANVTARVLVTGFVLGGVAVCAASVYAYKERLPGSYQWPMGGEPVMAGIGTNQNILAYTLTLALCGVCARVPRGAPARVAWLAALLVIGYGLVESHSATGRLTAAAVVLAAVLMAASVPVGVRWLRTRRQRAVGGLATVAVVLLGALGVARLLGSELFTFSDRTPLWSAAVDVAMQRPWGGFGYGAVWQHPWKPPLLNIVIGDIWDRSGMPLSHGHNSAVDLVVEVGLVGVLLMVMIVLGAGMRAVSLVRRAALDVSVDTDHDDDRTMARFIVLCLVALLVFGITEPMATIPIGWWTLVLLTEPRRRNGGSAFYDRFRSTTPQ
jgi:O-antigen ligase